MKRGPKRGTNRTTRSAERMRKAWGNHAPAWIVRLAAACDNSSQNAVAERIGYSPAAVSSVLNRRYAGDMDGVAAAVERALSSDALVCPEIGQMTIGDCVEWQDQAETFVNVSPLRVRMFRACRRCNQSRFSATEDNLALKSEEG